MKYFLLSLLLFSFLFSKASLTFDSETEKKDTTYQIASDDPILRTIDSAMASWSFQVNDFAYDTTLAPKAYVKRDSLYSLEDSLLEMKLAALNEQTPLALDYNSYVKAFINLYVNKRPEVSSKVLGLAPYYFPLFEEALDRHNMPLELKYLAVVESALNPSARSWVGAQGLWQFMYGTGKMYGLKVTSYYDDRMDPYKATEAACRYMNDLYKMYGDWNLVLAAYNSGPGNVNRAIRRSGGQKDYWKIRPFLPRETRGYVPAFIAVNYVLNHAEEHGIFPTAPVDFSFENDTIQIKRSLSFKQLAHYLNMDQEIIKKLNPQYKLGFIPESEKGNTLCLPLDYLGLFLTNEQAIYADIRRIEVADSLAGKEKENQMPEMIVHRVRSGEFLGYIANKYNCSVRDLMAWNNLRSTRLNPGDRLKIYSKNSPKASVTKKEVKPAEPQQAKNGKYQFHVVRSGDTLWDIAKKYNNTSVSELKRLNSNLNFKRLKPGMQVKVKEIG
ncbi:MAG: transglycosylase SLT domain-containing protein [Vicingaceae bacterium]